MGKAPTVTTLALNITLRIVVGSPLDSLVSPKLSPLRKAKHSQHDAAATQEVASIAIGMKPDQVTMQNADQNLIADRQDAVNFRAGERGVEEEADLDVHVGSKFLSQHCGKQHEVVIVNPYAVAILDISSDGFGK